MKRRLGSRRGFTLTELIIVFAIMGLISLVLVPSVGTLPYKSMGNTALTDCKIVMAAALTHNMNNYKKFSQEDLNQRMGLDVLGESGDGKTIKVVGPKTFTAAGGATISDYLITYQYQKAGVIVQGIISVNTQTISWSQQGLEEDTPSWTALKEGLKIMSYEVFGYGLDPIP